MNTYMQGTVKELLEQGITINGCKLDKVSLGVLLSLGMGKQVGEQKHKGVSGIAPAVWQVPLEQEMQFSVSSLEISFAA